MGDKKEGRCRAGIRDDACDRTACPLSSRSLRVTPPATSQKLERDDRKKYVRTYSIIFNPFRTAVPFWGATYLEFDWFVPKTGTAVLKGLIVLRGTILNRTYRTDKKLYILFFVLTIFGPIYYGPR